MRYTYFLLSCFLCCLLLYAVSQDKQKGFREIAKEYKEANDDYNRAIQVSAGKEANEKEEIKFNKIALDKFTGLAKSIPKGSVTFDSLHFFTDLKIAELAYYFDSLSLALQFYKEAIDLKAKLPSLPDSFLFKPYLFSGTIYFNQNKPDSATAYFKKAENIQVHFENKLTESERLYNVFGVLYYQSGNYKQAKNYFQKAVEVLSKNHPYYQDLLVNFTINFASVLLKLQAYDSAYSVLRKLIPYRQHLNEIYNNIGLIHLNNNASSKALQAFKRVHYGNYLDIGLHNDMAHAWLNVKQYDSARKYLQIAFDKNKIFNADNSSVDYGLSLKIYGDLQLELNQYREALHFYQQALHQFYPAYKDSTIVSNPEKFTGIFSYINLYYTLVAKAEGLHQLYLQSNNISWAQQELKTYQSTFRLLDYIERTYDSDEARLFLEKSKYLIRENPIDIAIELYQKTKEKTFLEAAYELDQKNKASVLAFNELQNQFSNPSAPLREKEQEIKVDITRLSIRAAQVKEQGEVAVINKQIREDEIALGKLQDEISKTYPVVATSVPTIDYLQHHFLDESTETISFHLSEKKLIAFVISQTKFTCIEKPVYTDFNNDLKNFVNALHTTENTVETDTLLSHRLYQFLLSNLIDVTHKRLIIIPDGELYYLPFEALKENNRYIVEDYSVQYQYSTILLKNENADFKKASTLAFAPFTDNDYTSPDLNFDRLPYSLNEIKDTKGKIFVDKQATKQNFLNNIPQHDIIHLATHAIANDSSSHLSFIAFAPWSRTAKEDYLLYGQEIYNLSLNGNRLIILSACETGNGELIKGEGIMSLSRAFAYAGCPNIITSLWKSDDQGTAFITEKIHYYLSDGSSIDEAVQKAKIDFLKSKEINPRMKAPAYWANLIFIGNYKPHHSPVAELWVLVFMIILAGFLYIKRKSLIKVGSNFMDR